MNCVFRDRDGFCSFGFDGTAREYCVEGPCSAEIETAELEQQLRSCATNYTCKDCTTHVYGKCDLIHKAADAIAALDNRQKWISVKERLPEPWVYVIICRPGRDQMIVEQGMYDVGGWWKVYGTRTKAATHWMPMPLPPYEDERTEA